MNMIGGALAGASAWGTTGSSGSIGQKAKDAFKSADTDQSGGLSLQELASFGQGMQVGNISPANSAGSEALGDLFPSIDSDSSGSLSQDELSGFSLKMSSQTQGGLLQIQEEACGTSASSSDTADSSSTSDSTTSSTDDAASQFMAQVDQDGDGEITLDELSQYLGKLASEDRKDPPPSPGSEDVAAAGDSLPPPPTGDTATSSDSSDTSTEATASTDTTTTSTASSSGSGGSGSSDDKSTDPADTNGDGVVSFTERMAYLNGGSTTDGGSSDASSASSQSDPMQALMSLFMKQATSAYSSTDSLTSAASILGTAA
jgi:Ca2+-binding EF-hand superfamily protein